ARPAGGAVTLTTALGAACGPRTARGSGAGGTGAPRGRAGRRREAELRRGGPRRRRRAGRPRVTYAPEARWGRVHATGRRPADPPTGPARGGEREPRRRGPGRRPVRRHPAPPVAAAPDPRAADPSAR